MGLCVGPIITGATIGSGVICNGSVIGGAATALSGNFDSAIKLCWSAAGSAISTGISYGIKRDCQPIKKTDEETLFMVLLVRLFRMKMILLLHSLIVYH